MNRFKNRVQEVGFICFVALCFACTVWLISVTTFMFAGATREFTRAFCWIFFKFTFVGAVVFQVLERMFGTRRVR